MLLFGIHFNLLLERIYLGKKKPFIVLIPQRVKVCKFPSHFYHKISPGFNPLTDHSFGDTAV